MQIVESKFIGRGILLCCALLLAACGSTPSSYLPTETVVNVEADVAQTVTLNASHAEMRLTNRSSQAQALQYQLFWYDAQGVTQLSPVQQSHGSQPWKTLTLAAEQTLALPLSKPTADSHYYRFYLRNAQ